MRNFPVKFRCCSAVVCTFLALAFFAAAQTPDTGLPAPASAQVPRLIRFSGIAKDETGKPTTGAVGVTFSLYKDEQGGAPLWVETQNVQADASGHYTALLGANTAEGIPLELFSSAEAHWVAPKISGQGEQARVPLMSVPYALKAVDAQTLGGLPASAFVQVNSSAATGTSSASKAAA